MGFVAQVNNARTGDNVDQIINAMVKAARETDVGGGLKGQHYARNQHQLARPGNLLFNNDELAQIPLDIVEKMQQQVNERTRDRLNGTGHSFELLLEEMAYLLYIQAKDPKADVARALDMKKISLGQVLEDWNHFVDYDKAFTGEHREYRSSVERLPGVISAVEAAMRQSLKDQKIGPEISIQPY